MTYSEKYTRLNPDAEVAVLALANPEFTDVVLLPLKPVEIPESEVAALISGRNLRAIGVLEFVDRKPAVALLEPLDAEQVSRLTNAFLTFCVRLAHIVGTQLEGAEIAELERMYTLPEGLGPTL